MLEFMLVVYFFLHWEFNNFCLHDLCIVNMSAASGSGFSKTKLWSQWFFHRSRSLHTNTLLKWVNVCLSSQIAKQQQQLIQQQHKINLLQQQIQVGCPPDIFNSLQRWSLLQMRIHHPRPVSCVAEKRKRKLKYFLCCAVLAGEHALRDDPGLPPQHPTPSGDLWTPDDAAAAADPLQARSVLKSVKREEESEWDTLAYEHK